MNNLGIKNDQKVESTVKQIGTNQGENIVRI